MDNKMTAEQANKTLRNTLIEILIATRCESEGHAADAILSALPAPRLPAVVRSTRLLLRRALQSLRLGDTADADKCIDAVLTRSPGLASDDTEPEWIDIPANLRRQSNMEQYAQQVIDDLRAEVEALKAKNDALIDLSNGLDKMYRKEMAKANALRKRISRIAAISHTGGLAGLGEGSALNMVRALTVRYMEKSDTRDEQVTRLNEAMAAARDESKARLREGGGE